MPAKATEPVTVEALRTQYAGLEARIGEVDAEIGRLEVEEAEARRRALMEHTAASSHETTRPLRDRQAELRRELESLDEDRVVVGERLAEAVAVERAARRAELSVAADEIRARQRVSLAKAGKLLAQLEKLWTGEIVEQARELTALRVGGRSLFDDPGEVRAAFLEPASPLPTSFQAFCRYLAAVAASAPVRDLVSPVWTAAVPDLRSSGRRPSFEGVDDLPMQKTYI